MPDWDDGSPSRPLNETERAQREAYLLQHPGDELRLPPFTNGFPEIADWVAAGSPDAAACQCPVHAQAAPD